MRINIIKNPKPTTFIIEIKISYNGATKIIELKERKQEPKIGIYRVPIVFLAITMLANAILTLCQQPSLNNLQVEDSNRTSYIVDQDDKCNSTSAANASSTVGPIEFDENEHEVDDGDDDKGKRNQNGSPVANHNKTTSFEDFDDYKALNLDDFYGLSADKDKPAAANYSSSLEGKFFNDKMAPPPREPKDKTDRYRFSETNPIGASSGGGDGGGPVTLMNACAMPLSSGACITFNMVELATSQARRVLRFRRPEGLESLEPSESTINTIGELNELTARILALQLHLTPDEIAFGMEQIDVRRTSLWRSCPRIYRLPMARSCLGGSALFPSQFYQSAANNIEQRFLLERYRSHTGQCNNPIEPRLGASHMPFVRMLPPEYADYVGSPRRAASGSSLPPPRLVALSLHPDLSRPSDDLSALFANWGQLINHDLAMASNARGATGHEAACCKYVAAPPVRRQWADPNWRVCMPIEIGADDPVYGPFAIRCHEFKRSLAGLRPGCSLGPRTQVNTITSFVDASFVYGSTRSASLSIRSRRRGQLAMWDYFGPRARRGSGSNAPFKPLLPPQISSPDEECVGRRSGLYCFLSGDVRTNQQIPLVALHTIHMRQHNRLAEGLSSINPHWPAARVYEEARHIHIALVQHILLNEYLPLLLGPKQCEKFNLTESGPDEYWDHYDVTINPGISQEFAAAAFRQGHSSVPSLVFRLDVVTRQLRRAYMLRQTFRQPWALFEPGAMDEFLLGLAETPAHSPDPFISAELSGHLLQEPDEPVGLDLVAINIQRGRDQGVAGYNAFREWCGLGRFGDFNELDSVMSNQSSQLMGELYESVDDIDLFTGGLSEFPLEDARVGPTFACIIGRQFQALRSGDRFWFESSTGAHSFTIGQLNSIKQVTLARLICANSDRLDAIQPLAMRLPHPVVNALQPCASLADVDLSQWLEPAPVAPDNNNNNENPESQGEEEDE